MSAWGWILVGCVLAFATKLVGYLVPESALDSPFLRQASAACTVGLLSALVVADTFGAGQHLVLDARVAALVAAVVALLMRVPFLGVVIVGTLAAALARLAGMA